ncbi:hypothetical protein IWX63_003299 [Arthrobacter sp. CAN_A2]
MSHPLQVIHLAVLTQGFRKTPPETSLDAADAGDDLAAAAHT